MPRRRSQKKRTRRKFTGINLTNAAEAYLQTSVITETMFNVNPIEFVLGRTSAGLGGPGRSLGFVSGRQKIGMTELLGMTGGHETSDVLEQVKQNVQDNWVEGLVKTAGITIGFRMGKKLLKRPRAQINRGIHSLGLGDAIRV